jgi:hypothetical protein
LSGVAPYVQSEAGVEVSGFAWTASEVDPAWGGGLGAGAEPGLLVGRPATAGRRRPPRAAAGPDDATVGRTLGTLSSDRGRYRVVLDVADSPVGTVVLGPRIGYTAPNARVMAERNLLDAGDGHWVRRLPRHLFTDAFEDDSEDAVLRMYPHVQGPTMIIRCTRSEAVLDLALDQLTSTNDSISAVPMALTHLAPAWDAIDEVVAVIETFLAEAPG